MAIINFVNTILVWMSNMSPWWKVMKKSNLAQAAVSQSWNVLGHSIGFHVNFQKPLFFSTGLRKWWLIRESHSSCFHYLQAQLVCHGLVFRSFVVQSTSLSFNLLYFIFLDMFVMVNKYEIDNTTMIGWKYSALKY